MRVKWNFIIQKSKELAENYKRKIGEPPTLRGIFYMLVSLNLLPNTQVYYISLSENLGRARKNGEYPWGLLIDKTRNSVGGDIGSSQYCYYMPDINWRLRNGLKELKTEYRLDYQYPRKWLDQPYSVFVILEKETITSSVHKILEHWNVPIYPLRGYGALTFRKKLYDNILDTSGIPVILMLTDFDPSGEDIVRLIKQESQEFGIDNAIIEKICVTKEQIENYKFPHRPEDAKEIKKLQQDTKYGNWIYGLYRVEIDAFLTLAFEDFKKLLNDSVSKYYDPAIWNAVDTRFKTGYKEAYDIVEKENQKYKPFYNKIDEIIKNLEEIENE